MNSRYIVYIALAALLLVGCATTPQGASDKSKADPFSSKPSPDKALIYIYRPWRYGGGANKSMLTVDGAHLANMKNGSYFPLEVDAGHIELTSQRIPGPLTGIIPALIKPVSMLSIDVETGETYYVNIKMGFAADPILTLSTAEAAQDEAHKIKEISPRVAE